VEGTPSNGAPSFADLIAKRNEDLRLGFAALVIARQEYPQLALDAYMERLDRLAIEFHENFRLAGEAYHDCEAISTFLAQRRGFRGEDDNYYDARNCYLNEVLDRGVGTPVSLGVIYLEVAQHVGLDLQPILFPSHFLLRLQGQRGNDIFIDPYTGRLLDLAGCRDLLTDLYANSRQFSESLVAPGTKKQVLLRLLQDLKFIYLRENNLPKAVRTLELMCLLSPWDLEQIRDRGFLYYRIGDNEKAAADLKAYLQHAPPGATLEAVRETLRRLP
jgi:regulator of sirC expression with transglutaminase-like and TPR domain